MLAWCVAWAQPAILAVLGLGIPNFDSWSLSWYWLWFGPVFGTAGLVLFPFVAIALVVDPLLALLTSGQETIGLPGLLFIGAPGILGAYAYICLLRQRRIVYWRGFVISLAVLATYLGAIYLISGSAKA